MFHDPALPNYPSVFPMRYPKELINCTCLSNVDEKLNENCDKNFWSNNFYSYHKHHWSLFICLQVDKAP